MLCSMSPLRIRIELNKGRVGMPFGKLARVCKEATKFLEMLSEDLDIPEGDAWVAEEFENGSVMFDVRHAVNIEPVAAEAARQALGMIFRETSENLPLAVRIRGETLRQFRKVTLSLDPDEYIRIGVYHGNEHRPDSWYKIPRSDAVELTDRIIDRGTYGEVQGVVNAFFKEALPPYVRIRELSSGNLVKCFFRVDQYQAAIDLLEDKDAVVFVEGWLREDASSGATREVRVEGFTPAVEFDEKAVETLFGAVPDYTGSLTSEQFVARIRGDR